MVTNNYKTMKGATTVLLEAIFVGALLVVVYYLLQLSLQKFNLHYTVLLFLSGALFHIVCEVTGLNVWYVKEYIKIL